MSRVGDPTVALLAPVLLVGLATGRTLVGVHDERRDVNRNPTIGRQPEITHHRQSAPTVMCLELSVVVFVRGGDKVVKSVESACLTGVHSRPFWNFLSAGPCTKTQWCNVNTRKDVATEQHRLQYFYQQDQRAT